MQERSQTRWDLLLLLSLVLVILIYPVLVFSGAGSGGKFVVSRAGEAYDVRVRGPNRKFRFKGGYKRELSTGVGHCLSAETARPVSTAVELLMKSAA